MDCADKQILAKFASLRFTAAESVGLKVSRNKPKVWSWLQVTRLSVLSRASSVNTATEPNFPLAEAESQLAEVEAETTLRAFESPEVTSDTDE